MSVSGEKVSQEGQFEILALGQIIFEQSPSSRTFRNFGSGQFIFEQRLSSRTIYF